MSSLSCFQYETGRFSIDQNVIKVALISRTQSGGKLQLRPDGAMAGGGVGTTLPFLRFCSPWHSGKAVGTQATSGLRVEGGDTSSEGQQEPGAPTAALRPGSSLWPPRTPPCFQCPSPWVSPYRLPPYICPPASCHIQSASSPLIPALPLPPRWAFGAQGRVSQGSAGPRP